MEAVMLQDHARRDSAALPGAGADQERHTVRPESTGTHPFTVYSLLTHGFTRWAI
jgi:hypothetical protein